ncbi:disabled homolog 1 isoform X1 [Etheostoma spectabile]|uniref:disabled homolog 1 isoform X1 n=1 Tax=Etheostoma spectabile TaxID=54343 RepID=UPI0013AE89EE|nr:disabled homolog 1-like isoform X1 [Etheostoma spectabile]
MMETEQTAASCHAPGQTSVRTWLSSSIRAAPRTPSDTTSRFHGDGVRYKAKLIGVDPVPDAQGEKMCWDSMMKLKGFEAAARKQGKHKQRVWLKVSSSGLRIVDERTGAVLYDHDRSRISSLTKDESDPRALAYVSQHQDTYCLFYIKMANLVTAHSTTCHADPVLVDIEEVCQNVDQETPQEAAEAPTQNNSLLLLSDTSAPPAEEPVFEDVFSPRLDSSSGQSNQGSFSTELMEVFSIQKEEPLTANQSSCTSQPEPPKPKLCTSQILSMFPAQPLGGSPYSSPPYSPTGTIPWGQQGLLGNQWAGSAVAPCPTIPSSMASWAPTDMAVGQILAQGPQPRVMGGGNTLASPTAVTGYPTPLNSFYAPTGATGPLQSVSPSVDQNRYL